MNILFDNLDEMSKEIAIPLELTLLFDAYATGDPSGYLRTIMGSNFMSPHMSVSYQCQLRNTALLNTVERMDCYLRDTAALIRDYRVINQTMHIDQSGTPSRLRDSDVYYASHLKPRRPKQGWLGWFRSADLINSLGEMVPEPLDMVDCFFGEEDGT